MPHRQRVLVIDSQVAGISGDMLLGALIDLGASTARLSAAFKVARSNLGGCTGLRLKASGAIRHGLRGKKADVIYKDTVTSRAGSEIEQAIVDTARDLGLSRRARQLAANVIKTLLEAERNIHGGNEPDIHLHELGSADTVADIIGVTVALEDLGFFEDTMIYATPVATGRGRLEFSHGKVPVPVPATLEILRNRNFPFTSGPAEGELATPTGVSLLVNLAHQVSGAYPAMKPLAVGYGAGSRQLAGIPNLLRITLGESLDEALFKDIIYILETNVDDVPGEVIGYTMERLFQAGARDVSVIPVLAKKNRPGQILHVIADENNKEQLARVLMEETGTLGVRFFPSQRYVLDRETIAVAVTIGGTAHRINVKVSRDKRGRVVSIKPEYEDVKALAQKSGAPLQEVARLAREEARDVLAGEDKAANG